MASQRCRAAPDCGCGCTRCNEHRDYMAGHCNQHRRDCHRNCVTGAGF